MELKVFWSANIWSYAYLELERFRATHIYIYIYISSRADPCTLELYIVGWPPTLVAYSSCDFRRVILMDKASSTTFLSPAARRRARK